MGVGGVGGQRGVRLDVLDSGLPGSVCLPEQRSPTVQPREERRGQGEETQRARESERWWKSREGKTSVR